MHSALSLLVLAFILHSAVFPNKKIIVLWPKPVETLLPILPSGRHTHMGSLPKLFRANCRLVWEADQSRSLAARDGTFLLQLPPPLWEEAAHIDFHRSWQGLSFVVACSVVLWLWRGGREVWRSICRDCHPFVRLDPTDYIIPRFGNRLLLNTAVIFYQDVNATNLRSLLSVSVYMSTMPFVV